ncbi:MAG: hypothetical protein GY832_17700 [Chloroflexi bacterium]|nr:hypothetical protein [Chloroflexota bacterium]
MQNRSLIPTAWGKVGSFILPGLFAGMALTVVLYRWIERRNRAAGNVQQNVIPLRQGATG